MPNKLRVMINEKYDSIFNDAVYNEGDPIDVYELHDISVTSYAHYYDKEEHMMNWIPKKYCSILYHYQED